MQISASALSVMHLEFITRVGERAHIKVLPFENSCLQFGVAATL